MWRAQVPAGTQSGEKVVMRGKGIKQLNRNTHGNQYVHFHVEIPKCVSLNPTCLVDSAWLFFSRCSVALRDVLVSARTGS